MVKTEKIKVAGGKKKVKKEVVKKSAFADSLRQRIYKSME